jgi:hypothetical protein
MMKRGLINCRLMWDEETKRTASKNIIKMLKGIAVSFCIIVELVPLVPWYCRGF